VSLGRLAPDALWRRLLEKRDVADLRALVLGNELTPVAVLVAQAEVWVVMNELPEDAVAVGGVAAGVQNVGVPHLVHDG
jgi:hypothetical protein